MSVEFAPRERFRTMMTLLGIVGRDNMVGYLVRLVSMTAKITALESVLLEEMIPKSSLCLPCATYRAFFRLAVGHLYMLPEKIGRSDIRAEGALSTFVFFKEMLSVLFADNLLGALRTLLESVRRQVLVQHIAMFNATTKFTSSVFVRKEKMSV